MEWISVEDELPETTPHSYMAEMSEKVLVKGAGKNEYPWIAHLHKDTASYHVYAWGFDRDGVRYTWLNPYRDIVDNQKITYWMPLVK
jgi:hypothetical protein